ncbi:MAG: hypothetical protein AAFS03_08705 [Pseudomonadota bacterium]
MIYVRDTRAAKLCDLTTEEFRKLVDAGALPPPRKLGGHERWYVPDLHAVATGADVEKEPKW